MNGITALSKEGRFFLAIDGRQESIKRAAIVKE